MLHEIQWFCEVSIVTKGADTYGLRPQSASLLVSMEASSFQSVTTITKSPDNSGKSSLKFLHENKNQSIVNLYTN